MNNVDLQIHNKDQSYKPLIVDEITWDTQLRGAPGKLTFKVLPDSKLNFHEGNLVTLKVDDREIFYGYVFTKQRDKDNIISVTAYDQIRYLKNKDTISYKELMANELLEMIAKKYLLKTGEMKDTGYPITRLEDNTSLLDMMQTALNITLQNKGKYYVLFDDFGKLTLKDLETMQIAGYIDDKALQNYSYTSSIDGETYTQIKLSHENKEKGCRDIYIVKNSNLIKEWGLLQYFEKIDDNTDGAAKAEALMKLYKNKKRSLKLTGVLGDVSLRAGNSIVLKFPALGDISLNNNMILTQVKHVYKNEEHYMDLTVKGSVING